MASDPATLYVVIAPITAAFAGFGSLASGLGQRRGSDDARVDAFRLSTMLFASLSATFLGLLPATLEAVSLNRAFAVRVSAVAALICIAAYVPLGLKRARSIRGLTGFSRSGGVANSICLLTAILAFGLCAAGWSRELVPGLYLLGLVGLLSSSIVMFSRVIGSMLRPAHSGSDEIDL
jgi:hypothetical protein